LAILSLIQEHLVMRPKDLLAKLGMHPAMIMVNHLDMVVVLLLTMLVLSKCIVQPFQGA
jgi:hypothetical protein